MNREDMLEAATDPNTVWDVAVIGGGATGLACAMDAALRGYRTILIEQADFAKGTSSRSTKLIHGGVRYLRQGDVGLVREALRERSHMLHNASGIVRPLPFVIPSHSLWAQLWYGTGLRVYDALAGRRGLKRSAWLSRTQVAQRLPNLKMAGVRGGTLFFDAQFDDTRLAIAMARTANSYGATLLNYAAARGFEKDGSGKIEAVRVQDGPSGQEFSLRARIAINATGVFGDSVRQMDDPGRPAIIRPAQGIHFVLEARFLGGNFALLIPETDDGRVLFAIPWHGRTLVGTTDTERPVAELEPRPLGEEIDYLLDHAGRYLAARPSRRDIRSVWAGLRPLIQPPEEDEASSAEISREHSIFVSKSGLLTIAGGKWTTCRSMAEDTIDRAAELADLDRRECRTRGHKLIPEPVRDEPAAPIHAELPYTRTDVEIAVENEMAVTLEDVLARRTRSLFLDAAASINAAPRVARQMAELRGSGEDWAESQVVEFSRLARNYLP